MHLQQTLFDQIKRALPPGENLADFLCRELSMSKDSAYRRLRGETALTLPEIKTLSNYFDISIDELLSNQKDSVFFQYKWINPSEFDYTSYLEALMEDTERIALFDDNEILFTVKDLPIFSNFIIPEIGEFKGYIWQKTAMRLPTYQDRQFDLNDLNNRNVQLGYNILKAYNHIPSTELWDSAVLNSLMSQIVYAHESGFFVEDNQAHILLDKAEMLLDHYALQATHGSKFLLDKAPADEQNFNLAYNEVIVGDNTLCLRTNDLITVYFTHNVINTMHTQDPAFAQQTWEVQSNLIAKSKSLTGDAERSRNKMFRRLKQVIEQTRIRLD